MTTAEDVDSVLAPGGALEAFKAARTAGQIKVPRPSRQPSARRRGVAKAAPANVQTRHSHCGPERSSFVCRMSFVTFTEVSCRGARTGDRVFCARRDASAAPHRHGRVHCSEPKHHRVGIGVCSRRAEKHKPFERSATAELLIARFRGTCGEKNSVRVPCAAEALFKSFTGQIVRPLFLQRGFAASPDSTRSSSRSATPPPWSAVRRGSARLRSCCCRKSRIPRVSPLPPAAPAAFRAFGSARALARSARSRGGHAADSRGPGAARRGSEGARGGEESGWVSST